MKELRLLITALSVCITLNLNFLNAQNNRDGSCANDINRNWISSKKFDGNGNVISESRVYSDYLGKPIQSQTKLISEQNVIAIQTISHH